jgi:acetoin utilization protein AcuB
MEVHEIMQTDVAVLSPRASLREVADLMHDRDVRHVPVLEGGQVVGIVSDRDVRCYLTELYRSEPEITPSSARKAIPVREVMQSKPVAVDASADVRDVIDLLLDFKIGAVVVSDTEGHLQGIVSYEDVLRGLREESFD